MLLDADELLRRLATKHGEVKGLDHACTALEGLPGTTEVRLAQRPRAGVEGELVIVAA